LKQQLRIFLVFGRPYEVQSNLDQKKTIQGNNLKQIYLPKILAHNTKKAVSPD
jgi:hypothetical protein